MEYVAANHRGGDVRRRDGDESDAVAIALCHIVAAGNEKQANKAGKTTSKKNRGGLSASLAHKVG